MGDGKSFAQRSLSVYSRRVRTWVSNAACAWAILFAAPHAWWALGIPFAFPGGEANHRIMMTSAWRHLFDVVVVVMSVLMVLVVRQLFRPRQLVARRWIPVTLAWLGFGMLTLRGVAGLVVDGMADVTRSAFGWPTFLLGGLLLGGVAWMARHDQ